MKINEKEKRPTKEDQHLLEELTIGIKDVEWLSKNYPTLRKKYPKQYIAVKNQKVIIAHKDLFILINTLKRQFGDPNEYLIDFVPDDNYTLVV